MISQKKIRRKSNNVETSEGNSTYNSSSVTIIVRATMRMIMITIRKRNLMIIQNTIYFYCSYLLSS